ncbi:MAG: hypothetical protein IJY25_03700 [Bacilli bacterium]|nr:hypothetical protein [Bacilli bacterium]
MFTSQEQDYIFSTIKHGGNFRQKFSLNNKTYHYSENTLFKAQLYRVFSLLSNKVGVNSVVYDYIKKEDKIIIFCESMIDDNEELIEYGLGGEEYSLENTFDTANNYGLGNSIVELYKQVFYSLLIRDIDKNVAFIKKMENLLVSHLILIMMVYVAILES